MKVCDVKGCRNEIDCIPMPVAPEKGIMGYDICKKHRKIIVNFIEKGKW